MAPNVSPTKAWRWTLSPGRRILDTGRRRSPDRASGVCGHHAADVGGNRLLVDLRAELRRPEQPVPVHLRPAPPRPARSTDPGISFSQSFSVTPGTVTQVSIPTDAQDGNSDSVDPAGIHVTAGSPVSVYGLNTEEFTTDGFLGPAHQHPRHLLSGRGIFGRLRARITVRSGRNPGQHQCDD